MTTKSVIFSPSYLRLSHSLIFTLKKGRGLKTELINTELNSMRILYTLSKFFKEIKSEP